MPVCSRQTAVEMVTSFGLDLLSQDGHLELPSPADLSSFLFECVVEFREFAVAQSLQLKLRFPLLALQILEYVSKSTMSDRTQIHT